ncbi:MAG: hypothetical protein KAW82_02620 [Desulfurellaceae bacterium]|nr:hypothetical protein [Desulfurellaceae bacterium]
MYIISILFLFSFFIAFILFPYHIRCFVRRKITGKDMHKSGERMVPEMGGMVIIFSFSLSIVLLIGWKTFLQKNLPVDVFSLLAVLSVVLIIGLIGIMDDFLNIRQKIKAIFPLFAALPLSAIKAGTPTMSLPFIGQVYFGILYPLLLVPIGVTGASNAWNMLAGFNGLEVGMGIVAMIFLSVVAYMVESTTALYILAVALGALFATLYYNWYPAKVFIGDAGTLSIGAVIACCVILGNFEKAGVIIVIPHIVDFLIKLPYKLPKSFGLYKNGKLYCPNSNPVGLCQLIMKISGGISERNLVLSLMGIETIFGALAVLVYL